MTLTTSSAEPLKLLRYSDTMVLVDDALGAEANRLRGALEHFEATCREPAFHLRVSHVADYLVQYAQQARGIDLWVRDVGVGFQLADSGGMYGPIVGAPMSLLLVSAGGATVEIPEEAEDEIKNWLQENQGKYSSFEEWKQAIIVRFPYLALVDLTADQWHRIFDYGDQAWETMDDALLIYRTLKVRPGFYYPGQKILSGGESIREVIGWSKNLNHLKLPDAGQFAEVITSRNVWRLVGKSGLHEIKGAVIPATKAAWWLAIAGLVINGFENWGEYHDEGGSKVVSGTVADTAVDLKYIALGTGIGVVIGGVVGGVIGVFVGPVGAAAGIAVGAKIGGFVGSIAGSFYASYRKESSDEDENLTDEVDERLPDFVDKGLDQAGKKLDDTVKFVEDALTPFIQNVIKLF